jgi:hypothetical protein
MSLGGRAAAHGSLLSIYKPTYGSQPDGSQRVTAWTLSMSKLPAVIEGVSDDLVQKVYGGSRSVKDRALVPNDYAIEPGDGVVVTDGKREGELFRVEDVRRLDQGANPHMDVALVSTTEVIG